MKVFSITAVLVFVAAAILPAFAAPLPSVELDDNFKRYEYITLEERGLSVTARAAISWLNTATNHAAINTIPLVFYSGSTMVTNTKLKSGTSLRKAFQELDKLKNAHPCNDIAAVLRMAPQQSVNSRNWTPEDWLEVSRALANTASGTVRVLLGQTVAADSVWIRAERPALIANRHVTAIEHWEIATDGTVVRKANIK